MAHIAFIGLGVMGYPMAGHLQKKGHDVTVYNRTPAKAETWVAEYGGKQAATPVKAATGAEFVLMCIGNDNDIRSVVYGEDGVFAQLNAGAVLIDHTTASADIAKELAQEAQKKNAAFLDAPVSGGESGAVNGQLTVMVGGDPETYSRATPVFDCFAKKHTLLGVTGHGQLTKMINQICICGVLQGLSEGLLLARHAGLDTAKVFEAISKGAAQSWQMENRSQTMINNSFDFGFAVDWMIKDLTICLNQAQALNLKLPLTESVKRDYEQLSRQGMGREDTSALCKVVAAQNPVSRH